MATNNTARGTFGQMGFILAAAGSAVGLGNVWKFPYVTYENGGGSFVLVYLLAVVLIGAPIMVAEILIGRRTQQSPVGAFLELARDLPGGKAWSLVGWLGVVGGSIILSYYSVIAGWTLYYCAKCIGWSVSGFSGETAAQLGSAFDAFLADGSLQVGFHALFMVATIAVVLMGVQAGIERTTKLLMPVLAVILIGLVINSVRAPGFGEAINFLFHIGPISANGILEAVGQAFFSLSLGMGAMITYGSYVSRRDSIPRASAFICSLDTLVALMASVVMFAIIFSVPLAERGATFSRSPTILFTTLPRMFYELPGGVLISPVFYILVAFAALTSTISLLEVVVSYFIDCRGWSRNRAAITIGGGILLLGIPSALSLGASAQLSHVTLFHHQGFFGIVDYLASSWMLPVGALLIATFAGWMLSTRLTREELEAGHGTFRLHGAWVFLLRFVCPLAILSIIWAVIQGRSF